MTVYLVGAGPGDPGLLTVRGREVLERADVVVYDRLSVASLLDLAPLAAERINVGKRPRRATMPQEEINELLVERGRAGQEVVRLKGGDPFVFARGGEEAAALAAARVPFEVVPGITSAVAVPAYAGIPLTLRHSSTSFTVVTGHEDPATADQVDWDAVARVGGTLVVLMGVARIGAITERLLGAGLDPDTPAAAVRWGTRPEQHTTRATLATLADQPLEAPSVIVVGSVAALDLRWFEDRPLLGRRVVVTRARHQAGSLAAQLAGLGAAVVEVPTITIDDPADGGEALATALDELHTFDWLVLTSTNAVDRVFAAVTDARALAGPSIAVIGTGTATHLHRHGIVADLVPERFVAEGLLDAFPPPPPGGGRVLVARAAVGRDVLPVGLRERGWEVEVVDAYRTVPAVLSDEQIADAADADAITFTSASTVDAFVAAAGVGAIPPVVVCIGPVVADACREHGIEVTAVADPHTIDGLCEAMVGALPAG